MPTRPRPASTASIAQTNRQAILDALKSGGPLSRSEICERTGLSSATVSRLTRGLVHSHMLRRVGTAMSTGGRRSELFEYAGDYYLVGGIEVTGLEIRGMLVDLDGRTIRKFNSAPGTADKHGSNTMAGDRLNRLFSLIDEMTSDAATLGNPLISVGISVPGNVHGPDGTISRASDLGWESVPLLKILRARYSSLPIFIEKDVNVLVLGEVMRGAAHGRQNVIGYIVDTGVGAGVFIHGELFHGSSALAGEIGHSLVDANALQRYFPQSGDLEERIGAAGLGTLAYECGLISEPNTPVKTNWIFERASSGDLRAQSISKYLLDTLAIIISANIALLDPETIILGPTLGSSAEFVIEELENRLIGRVLKVPEIIPSALGGDVLLVGASELAIRNYFETKAI